ncbi:MAG TPA: hypothetical protein VF245_11735 [Solirubrobacterales bacterium]
MTRPYGTACTPLLRFLAAAILLLIASVGPGFSADTASAATSPPAASAPFASADEEEWEEEPGEWEVEDDEEEWVVEEDEGEWEVEYDEEEAERGSGWEASYERQRRDPLEPCMAHRANASASEQRDTVRRVRRKEMSKARAAKAFVADLDMGTPSYCEHRRKRHLPTKRRHGSRVVWSEPAR